MTSKIWDASSGRELCTLISFTDGTWAVTDPEDRYDASNGGDVEGLHWVIGNEPIALSQLKTRYYDPGLLSKIMGFNKEPLRDVTAFTGANLYPEVAVAAPKAGSATATVSLTNRGGGIGRVELFVNGKRVADDVTARAAPSVATAGEAASTNGAGVLTTTVPINLARYQSLMLPGDKNKVEVRAYDAKNLLESRSIEFAYAPPAATGTKASAPEPPHLYALVAGISHYRGGAALDLRYPAKDAQDFADAVRLAAAGENLPLDLTLLVSPSVGVGKGDTADALAPDPLPTRDNIVAALAAIRKKAKPTDILLVYLSGHGVNYGGVENGDYYYLTQTALDGDLHDEAVRARDALSGTDLASQLIAIPALKQVVILDTCASGAFVQQLAAVKELPGSTIRSWERMKDRTGMFLLAGCAGDSVSYEASRYGQGLLTYSLLESMQSGEHLRDHQFVDVEPLFQTAADRVQVLAQGIGGVQKPVLAARRDARSFDIGKLSAAERAKIRLARPLPTVVRPVFQDEVRVLDTLGLTAKVDAALRDSTSAASTRGSGSAEPSLVYWDVAEAPNAYQVVGRYRVEEDGAVTVTVHLFQGEKGVATFPVTGTTDKADKLAGDIVAAVAARLVARARP